jgi:hypothetical protein
MSRLHEQHQLESANSVISVDTLLALLIIDSKYGLYDEQIACKHHKPRETYRHGCIAEAWKRYL